MTIPLIDFAKIYCGFKQPECCKSKPATLSMVVFDTLLSITCLAVGILALQGTIALPPAGAYSLIGISSGITLLWLVAVALVIKEDCCKE